MTTEKKAEKQAINSCRENGGRDCIMDLAYYNQCGVIAWGDEYVTTAGAGSIKDASDRALQTCGARSSGCRIVLRIVVSRSGPAKRHTNYCRS